MRFAADEGFNRDIVRGVQRLRPTIDILRVQDAGLSAADDSAVLAWAAREGRVLLTHDAATMSRFAYERIARDEGMPGVFEVDQTLPIKAIIEDLVLIAECSIPGEWDGQVRYLPLR